MLTRRDFVKRGVALVTLGTAHAMLPPVFKGAYALHASDAGPSTLAGAGRTLLILQLAGGNDGLNTVIPYRDPAYATLRPTLKVAPDGMIPLSDNVALHPKLAALKPIWDARKLAVVQGVGYSEPSFSHFQSMLIWQHGGARAATGDGWLGSYLARLESEEHDPLRGFNVGGTVAPELYSAQAPVVSATDAASYGFKQLAPEQAEAGRRQAALLKLYEQFPKSMPYAALLETTASDAVDSSQAITAAAARTPSVAYPQTSIGSALMLVSQVVASGAPLRVAHVTLGGFDTHAAQVSEHERLLGELADGLAAFYADLASYGMDGEVLTMTWSEFGRRAAENASAGTDHGTAAPLFVIGGTTQGGLYGEAPSLENLDAGNLKFTTDFRSVYASVLERWVGVSPDAVLGERVPAIAGLIA